MNIYHIYNDDIGYPYVYIVTEDEQIEVLYTGTDIIDCERWIIKQQSK